MGMGGIMTHHRTADWAHLAALIAGISYLAAVYAELTGPLIIVWKGLGVGLLALFCARAVPSQQGWHIATIMAFGAAGDVVLDIHFMSGAVLFAIGHVLAAEFYWSARRTQLSHVQQTLSALILLAPPVTAWVLTARVDIVFYTILLAVMASLAWRSRFSQSRVGLGALFFVISDLLIFARMGPLADQLWASLAIWGLYFGGQYLIATGVVRGLGYRR